MDKDQLIQDLKDALEAVEINLLRCVKNESWAGVTATSTFIKQVLIRANED